MNQDLESGPACQWPSGLKFLNSKYVVSRNNEVAYTRGEGLNFHNTEYGLAYENDLHDNPTNIYCDNSSKIIIRNNIIYSTPQLDQYWKTCPADTVSPPGCKGVLLANEGGGCNGGVIFDDCHSRCILTGRRVHHIDSILIYNNFFVNTEAALSLWQGNTDAIGGPNCLTNIFFEHNTVVGLVGDDLEEKVSAVYGFFPNAYNTITGFGYATVGKLSIRANIFSLPSSYPNRDLVDIRLHPTFPVPFEMIFDHNLVNFFDERLSSSDQVTEDLVAKVTPEVDSLLKYLTPCQDNLSLIKEVSVDPRVVYDFTYHPRTENITNVGALHMRECHTVSTNNFGNAMSDQSLKVYPNPASTRFFVEANSSEKITVRLYSTNGLLCLEQDITDQSGEIDLTGLPSGIYFVFLCSSKSQVVSKLVVK